MFPSALSNASSMVPGDLADAATGRAAGSGVTALRCGVLRRCVARCLAAGTRVLLARVLRARVFCVWAACGVLVDGFAQMASSNGPKLARLGTQVVMRIAVFLVCSLIVLFLVFGAIAGVVTWFLVPGRARGTWIKAIRIGSVGPSELSRHGLNENTF